MWRSVIRGGYTSSAQTTSPGAVVRLAKSVGKPLNNLKTILEDVDIIDEILLKALAKIPELGELRLRPSIYTLGYLSRERRWIRG